MGKGTFNCVKWMLTIFNFIFIVCGLTVCAVGVWILIAPRTVQDYINPELAPITSYILLGIGGFIVLVSFCGCAGAGLENRCLLCMFFTVLCGVFVACLVGVILICVFRNDLRTLTREKMKESIINKYGNDEKWTKLFDKIQYLFGCCGVDNNSGIQIYQKTSWYKSGSHKVPKSCCIWEENNYKNEDQCVKGDKAAMYTQGCIQSVMEMISNQYLIFLSVLIGLGVILIVGMILVLVHLKNIINNPYYEYSQPI